MNNAKISVPIGAGIGPRLSRQSPQSGVDRAISPPVGVALLLAIVIALATLFGVVATDIARETPDSAPQLYVEWEEDPAGLLATPRTITGDVTLRLNGEDVTTLGPDDSHDEILLPVAIDDDLDFVADIGRQKLLLDKQVKEDGAGDFITYYTFEKGSGTTLPDRSANENDAAIHGPSWVSDGTGTALEFDGSDDYVKVDQLNAKNVTDVAEFTVAVKYRLDGDTGHIQVLVEHRNDTTNFEWFIETKNGNVPYRGHYSIWPDGTMQDGVETGTLNEGDVHVLVGSYDGTELDLYLDGDHVGSKVVSDTIEMGALYLGADAVGAASQHFEGRMYQFRLYYTAFDADDASMLTTVMEAEAE